MINKTLLCDTDFLISLQLATESTHQEAMEIYENNDEFVVLNITFWEVATVLSRKLTQDQAVATLERLQEDFPNIIDFQSKDEQETFKMFKSFVKKNISFFDCACLIVAQKHGYKIASFDKFYPREILIRSTTILKLTSNV